MSVGRMRLGWFLSAALLEMAGGLWLSGCGTPGVPQPPSLRLPETVTDLTAERAGGAVTLHWTMPKKTTDHLLIEPQIHGPVPVSVCVRETALGECTPAGETAIAPGIEAEFRASMPETLRSGKPRRVLYFVELKNKAGASGRSAGLSNPAVVVGGLAPAPVVGLAAEVRADGVALHWSDSEATPVRLHRKLLTPEPVKEPDSGKSAMRSPPEPMLRDLLVEAGPAERTNGALDKTARFGKQYEYTAQRVARVPLDGTILELPGPISAPVRVAVVDTFPPAVPQGLAAVFVAMGQAGMAIDLSWQPDTEADLDGYIVYRQDGKDWVRVSGPQPVHGPAYRDGTVAGGRSYRYAVTAIDHTGHESLRSEAAEEAVPNP